MNNQNPLSQKSVISFKSQVPQMTFQTEPIRNGDRKTSFKVVDFDGEHDVEAALIALDELINAREYLNTNNHGQPDLTVALIYVTALRLVQGRYGRTWGQRLNSVPPGARTIQRLRNELAELIDDVSGQTNARHGLLEYLERKLKFFEDRGLPSEYIARYKELIDYAERLNGTIPPPNDAMAKTWCIKSLSTDLQIYLDEQGGTDGINHYTDDPNFDFSDLGKLCNKKQRYLNANKKKGDNKNKRGRNDGNEESSGQGGSRKKAKKVHFFIDRQGQGPGQGNNKTTARVVEAATNSLMRAPFQDVSRQPIGKDSPSPITPKRSVTSRTVNIVGNDFLILKAEEGATTIEDEDTMAEEVAEVSKVEEEDSKVEEEDIKDMPMRGMETTVMSPTSSPEL